MHIVEISCNFVGYFVSKLGICMPDGKVICPHPSIQSDIKFDFLKKLLFCRVLSIKTEMVHITLFHAYFPILVVCQKIVDVITLLRLRYGI